MCTCLLRAGKRLQIFLVGIRPPRSIKPDPNGKFTGQLILAEPLGVKTILHIQSGQRTLLTGAGNNLLPVCDVMINIAFDISLILG